MTEPIPDIDSAEWAWDSFRRDVFQLVSWGYQIEEKEIRRKRLEEDITGLIRKGIELKFDEDLPPRFRCYSAKNEDPVDDAGTVGKKRPRIDITIESGGSSPRKRYRIEAKRCARKIYRSKYQMSWYVEGIEAFLSSRYAKDSPEGGMLGLMQSDEVEYWTQKLSDELSNNPTLACKIQLADIGLTPDLAGMTKSVHERKDCDVIQIFHAFLDCKPTSSISTIENPKIMDA